MTVFKPKELRIGAGPFDLPRIMLGVLFLVSVVPPCAARHAIGTHAVSRVKATERAARERVVPNTNVLKINLPKISDPKTSDPKTSDPKTKGPVENSRPDGEEESSDEKTFIQTRLSELLSNRHSGRYQHLMSELGARQTNSGGPYDASELEFVLLKAIQFSEAKNGKDSAEALSRWLDLAILYSSQNRFGESSEIFKCLADGFGKMSPENAESLGMRYLDLSSSLLDDRHLNEARALYGPVLSADKSKWLKLDEVSARLKRLASSFLNLKLYGDAEALYKSCLSIIEHQLNPNELDLATARRQLASVLRQERKFAAAEELYLMSLSAEEKGRGVASGLSAATLAGLVSCYIEADNQAKAFEYSAKLITAVKRTDPSNRREAFSALQDLALALGGSGKFEEADALVQTILSLVDRQGGFSEHEAFQLLRKYAQVCLARGNVPEAEKAYIMLVDASAKFRADNPYELMNSLYELAVFYLSYDKAEKVIPVMNRMSVLCSSGDLRSYRHRLRDVANQLSQSGHADLAEKALLQSTASAPPEGFNNRQYFLEELLTLAQLQMRLNNAASFNITVAKIMELIKPSFVSLDPTLVQELDKRLLASKEPESLNQKYNFLSEIVHSDVARSGRANPGQMYYRIALTYQAEDPNKAEQLYKKSLETFEKQGELETYNVANLYSSYSSLLYQLGRPKEAEQLRKRQQELQSHLNQRR